jgi:hypothetical protein
MIKNVTEQTVYKGWKELKLVTFEYLNKKGVWKSFNHTKYALRIFTN